MSFVSAHKYHSREEFLRDIQLLVDNCRAYNGPNSQFTRQAETILSVTKVSLEQVSVKSAQYIEPLLLEYSRTTVALTKQSC